MPPLVAPEHRPTLRDELAPLPARSRRAVIGVLGIAVLAIVVLTSRGTGEDGLRVVREGPVAFNLRHPASMRALRPAAGEWLHLERKGLDSFVVEPLRLPAYRGDVGGYLPVQAARELAALRERFPALEPVEEGKARVNKVAGYSLVFRASRRPRLYGRLVLLPEPVPGARDGVKLLLLATPEAAADKARDVGTRGLLKTPFRSFRFGTEGP
jgi:hypothetical protein